MGMTTFVPISAASDHVGLNVRKGRIVDGMTIAYPVNNPADIKLKAHGFIDGTSGTWDFPIALNGSTPDIGFIQELSFRLNHMFDTVNPTQPEKDK